MALRTGLIFCTLLLGSLAVPVPEDDVDMSMFFANTRAEEPSNRIVGGYVTAAGAHPYIAAITTGGNSRVFHCGSTIITYRTVLTAAHCVAPIANGNIDISSVRVIVGTNRFAFQGQVVSVSDVLVHPEYNPITIKNDIGIVYTATSIPMGRYVRGNDVSYNHVDGGALALVVGWGRTSVDSEVSPQLRHINVIVDDGNNCVDKVAQAAVDLHFQAPAVDPNLEICSYRSRGYGVCVGDTGGPLLAHSSYRMIGIISWGFPCALGAPDVHVRISAYRDWIKENLRT